MMSHHGARPRARADGLSVRVALGALACLAPGIFAACSEGTRLTCADAPCSAGFYCTAEGVCERGASRDAGVDAGTPGGPQEDGGPPNTPDAGRPIRGDLRAPTSVVFGELSSAVRSAERNIRLINFGQSVLTVLAVRFAPGSSEQFTLAETVVPGKRIAPGDFLELVVAFAPRYSPSASHAVLEVATDDPETPVHTIELSASCPECQVDPGCTVDFPRRLFPVRASAPTCADGRPTIGPDAVSWFYYAGCASWVEFETQPGLEIRIATGGDGCFCAGCVIWDINYDLLEDLGSGLEHVRHVEQPEQRCGPDGLDVHDETVHRAQSNSVVLRANGMFYFGVCSR